MERPKPEELPEEVLAALGITQADVFIVKHIGGGSLKIITGNARKLYYPPAPIATNEGTGTDTEVSEPPQVATPDVVGAVSVLQIRARARSTHRRKPA